MFDVVCEEFSAGSRGECEVMCFSCRAYERAEAVTARDGTNTSICNLYGGLLHCAVSCSRCEGPHQDWIHQHNNLKAQKPPHCIEKWKSSEFSIILMDTAEQVLQHESLQFGLLDSDPFKAGRA